MHNVNMAPPASQAQDHDRHCTQGHATCPRLASPDGQAGMGSATGRPLLSRHELR